MRNALMEPVWFTPPDGSSRTLWKDSPDPPPPAPIPDPAMQIRAQAAATPSAYTPMGKRVYAGDPNVPGSFHYTDTYAPSQQRQFDTRNRVAETLIERAEGQIPNIPATPFEFKGGVDPTTNQAYKAQMELINRSSDRDRANLEQTLANKGIPMGSEAWDREVQNFDIAKGLQERQVAAGANQQGFQQALGTRQQNYNELAALLGGQQLSPVANAPQANIDVGNAYAMQQAALNRNAAAAQGQYNADVASNNSFMGGLFGLGAAGITKFSDIRLKTHIIKTGEHPEGFGIYEYDIDGRHETGVLAQELLHVKPGAVSVDPGSGYFKVDYSQLGAA